MTKLRGGGKGCDTLAKIESFEDIGAWRKSRLLVRMVYGLSGSERFKKDYGLIDQFRRAAVSIMSNIAEGFGRHSSKAFANHLNIAHGSAAETQSLLYVAFDQGYVNKYEFDILYKMLDEISRMTAAFIRYLKKSALDVETISTNKTRNK